ncbi:MAG: class I SAM-dependent methyltransferase [Pyrinomonadaceae bacterium]
MFYVDDKSAALYDAALAPLERGFLRRWRAETMAVLPPEAQWLEVGAGTGLNFAHYPEGARGVASEPSGAMIRKARDQRNRPAGVQLVQSIVERLPFADDSFDAALATLVFCSVASPRDAFTELRRVVRPGGTIALLEHVRPAGKILGPLFDALSVGTVRLFADHFNRDTAREAKQAGLRVERVQARARHRADDHLPGLNIFR